MPNGFQEILFPAPIFFGSTGARFTIKIFTSNPDLEQRVIDWKRVVHSDSDK